MTCDFENMLYFFGSCAHGAPVKTVGDINVDKIRECALNQGIWTIIYPVLETKIDAKKYQLEFLSLVSKNVSRKTFIFKTLHEMELSGIKCCLLKGETLSSLYKDPHCRISGDTDILIKPEDEKAAAGFLGEFGYDVKCREPNHHHFNAYHKNGGLLEVHVKLYDDVDKRILFDGIDLLNEEWIDTKIDGETYRTLGINDNLMYLTAHYIKHFINSGGGVRQMMDLLLYIEKYKNNLDLAEYEKFLKKLNYDKLIAAVMTIGTKYFGFNYEIRYEELAEEILNDTEEGGIFGHATESRKNFYDEFCKRRTPMSTLKTKIFILFKKESGPKIFPSQKSLVNGYGYKYAKIRFLIPVAWVHRFIDVIIGKRKFIIESKNPDAFNKRMEMMKDLGMIE